MGSKSFNNVYQFKISLLGIKPPIWRRIQVPENFLFFELNIAIQAAMGWHCAHLHEFHIRHPKTGKKVCIIPDYEEEVIDVSAYEEIIKRIKEDETLDEEEKQLFLKAYKMAIDNREEIFDERKEKISDWFSLENNVSKYIYDLGDWYEHKIKLEKILPREGNTEYPICLAGKRACPPEDCGGIEIYTQFLEMLKKGSQIKLNEAFLDCFGDDFDPEYFDPKEVNSRFKRYFKLCLQNV